MQLVDIDIEKELEDILSSEDVQAEVRERAIRIALRQVILNHSDELQEKYSEMATILQREPLKRIAIAIENPDTDSP
jgi:hypothetical protein